MMWNKKMFGILNICSTLAVAKLNNERSTKPLETQILWGRFISDFP